nr:hypothetical protein OH820_35175 [Streptomyces sp. NBC_00857]
MQGPDHPSTLNTRNHLAHWRGEFAVRHNLARWRGVAGDAAGAAVEYEESLAHVVRLLGPDHPETLNVRNVLVYWRRQAQGGR